MDADGNCAVTENLPRRHPLAQRDEEVCDGLGRFQNERKAISKRMDLNQILVEENDAEVVVKILPLEQS